MKISTKAWVRTAEGYNDEYRFEIESLPDSGFVYRLNGEPVNERMFELAIRLCELGLSR